MKHVGVSAAPGHELLMAAGSVMNEQARLGQRIEGGSRLVEDEQRRVAVEGASEGQALRLTDGEVRASQELRPEERFVGERQPSEIVVDTHSPGRLDDVIELLPDLDRPTSMLALADMKYLTSPITTSWGRPCDTYQRCWTSAPGPGTWSGGGSARPAPAERPAGARGDEGWGHLPDGGSGVAARRATRRAR